MVIAELLNERSQRELADLLGVGQTSIYSWRHGKAVPTLENLERIASLRYQLVEDFVAYLYDRKRNTFEVVLARAEAMSPTEIAELLRALAKRIERSGESP